MTKTIKLSLAVLIAIAGFIVARMFLTFSKGLDIAVAQEDVAKVQYEESNDYDHDGLSNADEVFWNTDPFNPDTDGDGFLDGEEVLSRHDPTSSKLASKDDSLTEKTRLITANLTEGVADLVFSGLVAGDLKSTSTAMDSSIDSISIAMISDTLAVLDNIQVPDDNFIITESSKENEQKYLNFISDIISQQLAPVITGQPQEITRFFAGTADPFSEKNMEKIKMAYLAHAVIFDEGYHQLSQTEVPKNWVQIHSEALKTLKKISTHYRSIAFSGSDPLKMLVVMQNLQTVYIDAQSLLGQISSRTSQGGLISPNSAIFNAVNTLGY